MLPKKIIDFHVHLFPDRVFDAVWRKFLENYNWDIIYQLYYKECVEHLRERNVGPIVFSNYAHKKGIARGLNDWNIKIVEEFPELYCFGAYHPGDEDALEMADEFLKRPNILGFKLQLLVQRFYPHDERLFPMYEKIIRNGKRILFHVGTGPIGNEFVGIKNFRKLLKKFPELHANVAHMGALEYKEFIELLDEYPDIYLDTAFVFLSGYPGGFNLDKEYLERYKNRIVYGSDFPLLKDPREVEIEHLTGLNLSQEFYESVFWGNGISLIKQHSGI